MPEINVNTGRRSYRINVGMGLAESLRQYDLLRNYSSVTMVTNTTVMRIYGDTVIQCLKSVGIDPFVVQLDDGEEYKNFDSLNRIYDELLTNGADRKSVLLALGGGVVGDMTGFAASCYMRGIDFIQLPTTLLAQVDSSIGGKTGINHTLGKNMIGAFHQPSLVICDTATLKTLPEREMRAGIAEIIKYGIVYDYEFFCWLEDNFLSILDHDASALNYAVARSCEIKKKIVELDEFESNIRAILNFGHTYGHAIENGMGYGKWLHGEAVAAGMVAAATFSTMFLDLAHSERQRIIELLQKCKLPIHLPCITDGDNASRYLELMKSDKKNIARKINLVAIRKIGEACIFPASDLQVIASVESCLQE